MASNVIKVRKLASDVSTLTVDVRVTREFKARIAIGLWLIKLGARIIGFGVVVNETRA